MDGKTSLFERNWDFMQHFKSREAMIDHEDSSWHAAKNVAFAHAQYMIARKNTACTAMRRKKPWWVSLTFKKITQQRDEYRYVHTETCKAMQVEQNEWPIQKLDGKNSTNRSKIVECFTKCKMERNKKILVSFRVLTFIACLCCILNFSWKKKKK